MKYYFLLLAVCAICASAVAIVRPEILEEKQKVDLPEEYKEITKDTPIQGYMRGDVLVIEFKHNYNEK